MVGEGWRERAGEAHAEIRALSVAGTRAKGAEVFVSLEPCAHTGRTDPCADALVKAGVKRVVAAMVDPNPQVAGKGLELLKSAGIDVQVSQDDCGAGDLNAGFCQRVVGGRPLVRLKLAATLDGRTAANDGTSQWITGEEARADNAHDAHATRGRIGALARRQQGRGLAHRCCVLGAKRRGIFNTPFFPADSVLYGTFSRFILESKVFFVPLMEEDTYPHLARTQFQIDTLSIDQSPTFKTFWLSNRFQFGQNSQNIFRICIIIQTSSKR